jgi:hypothetical protein
MKIKFILAEIKKYLKILFLFTILKLIEQVQLKQH